MALKQRWFVEAKAGFESTLEYLRCEFGQRSVDNAYSDVQACIQVLLTFPDAGQKYKDLFYEGHEVRIFHMEKNSIIYCHDEETLFILAFWNNQRDDSVIADILMPR